LTDEVCAQPPDVVILTTDAGLSLWLEAADSVERRTELLDALRGAELLVRGPKVAGAAAVAGLNPTWCGNGTLGELESELENRDLRGRRVLVQLPPGTAPELKARLGRRGATVIGVVPYTHTFASSDGLNRIIAVALSGELDALVVTNRPAAEAVLDTTGNDQARFRACATAGLFSLFCLGPAAGRVFAGASPVLPASPRLGALARLVIDELPVRASIDLGRAGVVRGRVVTDDGRVADLAPREAGVLRVLAASRGRVVPRQELISLLWSGAPGSARALEVAVARLRANLGSAAAALVTVPRRGYMIDTARTR
jgi:uroporphyrinogen-III synthase